MQRAQDAAYQAQTQYLDPQFSQARSNLTQQLADQGIGINNAAYDRATANLSRQQQSAYQGAQDAAVSAGNQEQNTLFGQSLGAGQFANQAALQGGEFANQAALQGGQFANQTALQGGEFANQAALQGGQFANQSALQGGEFANNAALQAAQFANQAQGQGFGQQLQGAQLPLSGEQALTGAGTGAFGSSLSGLTGLNPNFGWATGIPTYGGQNTTVSPANVVGAAQVAANNANNAFTAQNTLNNQMFNGLGSLGSTLGITGQGGLLGSGSTGLFGSSGLFGSLFGGGGAALDAAGVAQNAAGLGAATGLDAGTLSMLGLI